MSIAEVTQAAFERSRVVMANEAHNGMQRCVRARLVGGQMVRAAHEVGVRRMAMEALPTNDDGVPITRLPEADSGYLAQPDMRNLIATALELGWTLWPYEIDLPRDADPAYLLSQEFTNERELVQARNLTRLQEAAPSEPLLVWCGNSHASKQTSDSWIPMGYRFGELSGSDHFVLDQTVTVEFPDCPRYDDLLAEFGDPLARLGGTAAIMIEEAPQPWRDHPGIDAIVLSTDNTLE